eukprot:3713397-Prymnesium_polylepis.1
MVLKAGARVDARDERGAAALHLAAERGEVDTISGARCAARVQARHTGSPGLRHAPCARPAMPPCTAVVTCNNARPVARA